MKKRRILLLAAVLGVLLLVGCKGKPLPQGMEEQALLDAGRQIVAQLTAGEYQAVADAFRENVRQEHGITAQTVRDLMDNVSKAGAYVKETDCLATAQTDKTTGESYGVAVLYCKHEKDDVMYRASFDTDLTLIGLSVEKK